MSVFWSTWGHVLLLILVWAALQLVVGAVYHLVRAALDRAVPDRLAQSTGEWLEELTVRLGLRSSVMLTAGRKDAEDNYFHPSARVICLDARTWHKRDPFFWATGAHELGHALVHVRWPRLGRLMLGGRATYELVGSIGRVLIFGNLFFGSATINDLALPIIQAGLLLGGLMVLDELLASGIALYLLRTHGRLRFTEMLSAATGLLFALATYLASVVGHFVFYLYFDFVAGRIEREVEFVPGEALGTFGTVVLVVLSVLLVVRLAREVLALAEQVRSREDHLRQRVRAAIDRHATSLILLVFLALTWDLATTLTGQIFFCLALFEALLLVLLALGIALRLPFMLLAVVLVPLLSLLASRIGDAEDDDGLDARIASGAGVSEAAHDAVELASMAGLGAMPRRVLHFALALTWLPFVAWYWLS